VAAYLANAADARPFAGPAALHPAIVHSSRNVELAFDAQLFRTEVSWTNFELLGFFRNEGFAPAARLCLELNLASK